MRDWFPALKRQIWKFDSNGKLVKELKENNYLMITIEVYFFLPFFFIKNKEFFKLFKEFSQIVKEARCFARCWIFDIAKGLFIIMLIKKLRKQWELMIAESARDKCLMVLEYFGKFHFFKLLATIRKICWFRCFLSANIYLLRFLCLIWLFYSIVFQLIVVAF